MHRIRQLLWWTRAVVFRPFFGSLGVSSYIGRTVFLYRPRRIHIGKRVRLFPGLRAEAHGDGRIYFHDNIAVGQGLHIAAMGDLHIGSGTLISGDVMITDMDHTYSDPSRPIHEQQMRYSRTSVGVNCFIGSGARIQAGTVLGDGCVVGANAVVRGNFPPHSVIVGAPAKIVKLYNADTNQWDRV